MNIITDDLSMSVWHSTPICTGASWVNTSTTNDRYLKTLSLPTRGKNSYCKYIKNRIDTDTNEKQIG